jgi:hypothetical protein
MPTNATPTPHMQSFSCLTCRQRKVKCDRRSPCSNCTRADKQCSFVAPVRGRRRRLKPPKEGLHAKLRRYERLLESYGATGLSTPSQNSDQDMDSDASGQRDRWDSGDSCDGQKTKARLVLDRGNSRYYDSPLWSNLGEAVSNSFRHPSPCVHDAK